ncbi:MAG: hypothetical protein AB7E76_05055 [Deferribacterales bacterium]
MKYFLSLMLLMTALTANAGDLINAKPEKVREFENFRIKLNSIESFNIDINMPCIKIQRMENITKNGETYRSDEGAIYFENGCFEGDEVIITIKSGEKSEAVKLKLDKVILEERDYGC